MALEFRINGTADPAGRFLSYAPAPCSLSREVGDPDTVELRCTPNPDGGVFGFYTAPDAAVQETLTVDFTVDGNPAAFWIGGLFGQPSSEAGDTALEAKDGGAVLLSVPLMVRLRKDANRLSDGERTRFLDAFGALNDAGMGDFRPFRDMHTFFSDPEAHGDSAFLPWHRAYLLDLERELQRIDPSVALPYWRFNFPAPNLFQLDFMGVAGANDRVQFAADNPLQFWSTDMQAGILRSPEFDTQTEIPPGLRSEGLTLGLGTLDGFYSLFRSRMEGNPHGTAHVGFRNPPRSFISSIHTAAKDPLFFLLHCNVDRLWAIWQWLFRRRSPTDPDAYDLQGREGDPGARRIGHNRLDTMWPWNQVVANPRPDPAPGGNMAESDTATAPGLTPTVGVMVDYQGEHDPAERLGFDYFDVPYGIPPPPIQ